MSADAELVQAFLEESTENLDQLDLDLVALEANPSDPELLGRVFRTIHTVKGTCGFLDYGGLEALSHAGEDLLAALRDGALVLDQPITSSLLRLVDEIRGVLAIVARTGEEGDLDHAEIIAELRGHLLAPQAPAAPANPATPVTSTSPAGHEETSIRIDVAVLDRLQDLVGELTLARLRLGDLIPEDGSLAHAFHKLTVTTRDVQDSVMQARLQPVSTVTDRLRRIVRDLAAAEGKQVVMQILGDDVAVDKAINEVLRDPLLHLVRNAVDHGVEPPEQRLAAGKSATATVQIAAAVIGGGVQIEVSDDGRGIDGSQLVAKAVQAGRLTAQRAETLSEMERLSLLFLPGVSTAAAVTTVSGRGVGMDVVRANLELVGGSIDLWSEAGSGATFRIHVPLTLAILPAIVVLCGEGKYTIPQADVQAIVRVSAAESELVQRVGVARFLRYRGTLLPLIDLSDYLGVTPTRDDEGLDIVVIHRLERMYGLIVDGVGDSVEVVVKPLPRALRGIACYAGVTVLSDGRPSLILEVSAPAAEADVHQHDEPLAPPLAHPRGAGEPMLTMTVADNRLAVPLERVTRLISVAQHEVEHSGHDEVVQDGAVILPLIRVGHLLGLGSHITTDELVVVVARTRGGLVGLVVDSIIDIETADTDQAEPVEDRFLLGRLVISGRVTELLDVQGLADQGISLHRRPGPASDV